ncbi:MAG TPA: 4-hydroxythreonine-4-phosphate dehydrogenase PdxA, partial [Byssovorax sp.]
EGAAVVLVGDPRVLARAAELVGVAPDALVIVASRADAEALPSGAVGVWAASEPLAVEDAPFGAPTRAAGAAELAWIDRATDLVRTGEADALVTGPVSKHAIATSGAPGSAGFRGHTEHLAERLGAREVVMAFASPELTTALVTTHLPLARVPEAITIDGVASSIFWLSDLLVRLGHDRPRVAVAALNPHAGEGGLLGDEEERVIAPGVASGRARNASQGIDAEIAGPIGAETAFRKATARHFDGVVAMYHDQATIPSKLLGFGEAVNVTLGLPIVRTSVDHGTGYDIAGLGKADPRGMMEALTLAARLARR